MKFRDFKLSHHIAHSPVSVRAGGASFFFLSPSPTILLETFVGNFHESLPAFLSHHRRSYHRYTVSVKSRLPESSRARARATARGNIVTDITDAMETHGVCVGGHDRWSV